jgi:hypothetical protein
MLIAFVFLRFINLYGDPHAWAKQSDLSKNIMAFLDVEKYPPSLMFTLLFLGIACVFLAIIENINNTVSRIFIQYGRVPFFYYIAHIYLIHFLCVLLYFINGYHASDVKSLSGLFLFRPAEMGFDLGGVYLIWIGVVVLLYWPCKWYERYKSKSTAAIFKYL